MQRFPGSGPAEDTWSLKSDPTVTANALVSDSSRTWLPRHSIATLGLVTAVAERALVFVTRTDEVYGVAEVETWASPLFERVFGSLNRQSAGRNGSGDHRNGEKVSGEVHIDGIITGLSQGVCSRSVCFLMLWMISLVSLRLSPVLCRPQVF